MSTLVKSAADILAEVEADPQYAPHDDPDWLTPGAVMAILGWKRSRLTRDTNLPYQHTLGGHRRYRRVDVETFRKTAQG